MPSSMFYRSSRLLTALCSFEDQDGPSFVSFMLVPLACLIGNALFSCHLRPGVSKHPRPPLSATARAPWLLSRERATRFLAFLVDSRRVFCLLTLHINVAYAVPLDTAQIKKTGCPDVQECIRVLSYTTAVPVDDT